MLTYLRQRFFSVDLQREELRGVPARRRDCRNLGHHLPVSVYCSEGRFDVRVGIVLTSCSLVRVVRSPNFIFFVLFRCFGGQQSR